MSWQHWGRGVCCWLLWAAGVGLEVRADDLGHPWPATTSVATAGFLGTHLATLPDGDRYRNQQNTFSPDGELLAVLGSDGHIRVWNWRRKQLLQTLLRDSRNNIGDPDQTLAFSPDGRWLAYCHPSAKDGRNLSVWNTHDWQLQPTEPGGRGDCTGLKFSSNGRELLVLQDAPSRTSDGSRLSVYRSADWQVDWQWGLSDRFFGRQMALSPDGKTLAIAGERYPDLPINWSWPEKHRYQLHFLSLVTRQVLFSIEPMLEMRRGRMVWRPDGQVLAMFGSLYPLGREPSGPINSDGLHLYAFPAGELIHRDNWSNANRAFVSVRYSPDGKYLLLSDGLSRNGYYGQGLRILDAHSLAVLQEIPGNVTAINFSADGRYLSLADRDEIRIHAFTPPLAQ